MKRLTLNETWKLCLRMWKWVAKQKREGSRAKTTILKSKWMENNWAGKHITDNCFFCDYALCHTTKWKGECPTCPGTLVDKEFDCSNKNYNWSNEPIAFYNKLVSLNRKRKKK